MSEKTPGQVTCEAFGATLGYTVTDWDRKPGVVREAWEAAARAGAGVVPGCEVQRERDELRGQLAATRQRLEILANSLEQSAAVTSPSKKSQIEQGCAEVVREVIAGLEDEEADADEADEAKYQCAQTSDGEHTADWYGGGDCDACGQPGPKPYVSFPGAEGSLR